jgi:hypothetical protein
VIHLAVKEIAVLFACHKEFPNKRVNYLHLLIEAATTQYIIQLSYVSIDFGSSYFFIIGFVQNINSTSRIERFCTD